MPLPLVRVASRCTLLLGALLLCSAPGGGALAGAVYKCTNAHGDVVFSDRVCPGSGAVRDLKISAEPDLSQRKAESDARISRDKALASQVEAGRLAREQAGRTAQDQQVQAGKAVSDRVDQERAQRNAATVSDPGVSQSAPTVTAP